VLSVGSLSRDIEIGDTRTDEGDWCFKALLAFPDEVIALALDLRIHEDRDYLPPDAGMIVRRRRQWLIDNWRRVIDRCVSAVASRSSWGFSNSAEECAERCSV
jgi:hypothetical protein